MPSPQSAHRPAGRIPLLHDLVAAAAQLYAMMRALDAMNPTGIAVMPIPETGLGEAIMDRLQRSAAPRL